MGADAGALLERWQCSGEWQAAFARRNGVHPQRLSYWKRVMGLSQRSRVADGRGSAGTLLVQAQVVEAHRSMQADLVTLSREGRLVAAEDSGHYVHWDRPQVVVAAVNDMVESLRRRSVERKHGR